MKLIKLSEAMDLYESSMSRIYQHLEEDDIATITAFVTEDNDSRIDFKKSRNLKKNRGANRDLGKVLRSLGYSYIKLIGYYKEEGKKGEDGKVVQLPPIREESFFVIKPAGREYKVFVEDMVNMANVFEQESVIVWNHETGVATMYATSDFENYKKALTFKGFKINKVREIAWTQFKKDWFAFGADEDNSTSEIAKVEDHIIKESANSHTKLSSLALRKKMAFGKYYY